MRIANIDIVTGMQARGDNGANKPWFGFAYGSWIPRCSVRRNDLFSEFDWSWLRFHGFITVWR